MHYFDAAQFDRVWHAGSVAYTINLARWAASLSLACCAGWFLFAFIHPEVLDIRNSPAILRWSLNYLGPAWLATGPLLAIADRNRLALRNRGGTAFIAGVAEGVGLLAASEALGLGFTQGQTPVLPYVASALVAGVALVLYYSNLGQRMNHDAAGPAT